ncbi:MAG: aspartate--tRNA ligase [Lentisphaerae bacterium]|nr:aspartate--tRNA ligase [Lentisphaerota bacterium]MCP4101324.1 aspartate--tRNA ligase [Lentisphaerota bacterium]
MSKYRTHTCAQLRKGDVGETVRLSGWIHSVRDHGGVIFIDLRDHFGLTQVVINPEKDFYQSVDRWRVETVIQFDGKVVARTDETVNAKLRTGEIEVVAEEMEILGPADIIPFQVAKEENAPEAMRLKYRFLDLRREKLHNNIILRTNVIRAIRENLWGKDFHEFQTPILTASSPEGARDYLVPSRIHPGQFYALPQAPQQFKQLLMVSGFDKYFQIAPCFRDEDARADRSPGEFYQLDLEMSFATQDDVFNVIEDLFVDVFNKFSKKQIDEAPFVRIPYAEAMSRYGSDKPDLRNPLEMIDVTETFRDCEFKAFAGVVAKGGVVRAIKAPKVGDKSRKFFDDMIKFAQGVGAKGMAYIIWTEEGEKSPIAKFLSKEALDQLKTNGGVEPGDALFFLADKEKLVMNIGGHVITELGKQLDLIDPNVFKFCWIVDFPMFELDEETNKVGFSHNPFSMPQGGMDDLLNKDPLEIKAFQYDIVCNGTELSSGAIRNHRPDIMYKAFEIAGYDKSVVNKKFGGMINAFKLGAPPHGGIAPGVDRIVMLLADEPNIREVIAFPFNQQAQDLMMNAPCEVTMQQLRELHLKVVMPKKDRKEQENEKKQG